MAQPLETDGKVIQFPDHYLRKAQIIPYQEKGVIIPIGKPFLERFWRSTEEAFAWSAGGSFVIGFSSLSILHYGVPVEAAAYPLASSLFLGGAYALTRSTRMAVPRVRDGVMNTLANTYNKFLPLMKIR